MTNDLDRRSLTDFTNVSRYLEAFSQFRKKKPHSKPNPPGKPKGSPPPISTLGPKKPIGHRKPKGKGGKGDKDAKGDKGQHPPRSLDDDEMEDDYAGEENNLYARDDADGLSCNDGVPSVARIKEELKDKTLKDSCLFYSGPQGYSNKATQWRNKPENRQYRILAMNCVVEFRGNGAQGVINRLQAHRFAQLGCRCHRWKHQESMYSYLNEISGARWLLWVLQLS
ncbi:uncharacterized protein KD926_010201 [Aspergillus affinis]|uniref:uncharacterized protein n=1 Tax=Aspergillus affinis TaxID=1070780 RepID=UPI0022FE7A29|nr:uncharacterized protein KD926_010201 [Aspergillus affinis]KAI9038868.1 hypothetical protein KD926_010201 [Aspergillus affinis]